MARALKNVTVLTKLFAMTSRLAHRPTAIFTTRRPLEAPVGIPRDFAAADIHDATLAPLVALHDFASRLENDTMPLPSTNDREGYYGDDHFNYWLSGLSDYLLVKSAAPDIAWDGARVLDFGGATGRVGRHFYAQVPRCRLTMCDVNINNIEWVIRHLPDDIDCFKNAPLPSLPIPDNSFDVIIAFSVFTHMDEYELAWLYELERILKPGGMLYASVHNDDTWRVIPTTWVYKVVLSHSDDFKACYQPDQPLSGRVAFRYSPEEVYNCNTFHPNAYLRRVWGRIFDLVDIRPLAHSYQSGTVLRKRLKL